MSDGPLMLEHPRRDDGTINLARLAGELARDLNPIGQRLGECASHLAYMRRLLPQGPCELTDEFQALVQHLAWIENAYHTIDERLVQAATLIDHEERVPNPLPLGRQLRNEAA